MRNSYTFLDGYLTWITSHVASTEVEHQTRGADRSSYSFGKLVEHSVNIFITFSDLPVRLLSLTGILVFCLTTLYSGYLTVRKLIFQDLLPGYASLMIAIGLGVGLMLLGMGILGEYLRRINQKTTQHPPFVEAQRLLDGVEDWPSYPRTDYVPEPK
jgi:undecaprenyl-phosphate 4-deoxy-4-formamido-L-arabinose transferase